MLTKEELKSHRRLGVLLDDASIWTEAMMNSDAFSKAYYYSMYLIEIYEIDGRLTGFECDGDGNPERSFDLESEFARNFLLKHKGDL